MILQRSEKRLRPRWLQTFASWISKCAKKGFLSLCKKLKTTVDKRIQPYCCGWRSLHCCGLEPTSLVCLPGFFFKSSFTPNSIDLRYTLWWILDLNGGQGLLEGWLQFFSVSELVWACIRHAATDAIRESTYIMHHPSHLARTAPFS